MKIKNTNLGEGLLFRAGEEIHLTGEMWPILGLFKREGIPFKQVRRGSSVDSRFGIRVGKTYLVPLVDVINELTEGEN